MSNKSDLVKELALYGKFSEIEKKFGLKAKTKAREYAISKVQHLRDLQNSGQSIVGNKAYTPFIVYAINLSEDEDIEDTSQSFLQLREDSVLIKDYSRCENKSNLSKIAISKHPANITPESIQKPKNTISQRLNIKVDNKPFHLSKIGMNKNKFDARPKKKVKDPNAPKGASSAYIYFAAKVRSENVGKDIKEIGRIAGAQWNDLTEEEKQPFVKLATKDKERFAREMLAYKSNNPKSCQSTKLTERSSKFTTNNNKKFKDNHEYNHDYGDESDDDESSEGCENSRNKSVLEEYSELSPLKKSKRKCTMGTKRKLIDLYSDDDDDDDDELENSKDSNQTDESPLEKVQRNHSKSFLKSKSMVSSENVDKNGVPIEDLAKSIFLPPNTGPVPDDYEPAVGDNVVLIPDSYKEFILTLPDDVLHRLNFTKDEVLNSFSTPIIFGFVKHIDRVKPSFESKETEICLVTMSAAKDDCKVIYVPVSSELLTTDLYLLEKEMYTKSLNQPWLVIGAQVKRGFSVSNQSTRENSCIEYAEGIIYDVRSDYKLQPYLSILVVWLDQDRNLSWAYKFLQTENECSPWDLEMSSYILPHQIKELTFPDHIVKWANNSESRPFTIVNDIIEYFSGLDISYPFLYRLDENEEYVQKFPSFDDQIDFHKLKMWSSNGRYRSKGVKLLFEDLLRMTKHGKLFNQPNCDFQVWRLIDILEKSILRFRKTVFPDITESESLVQLSQNIEETEEV